MSFCRLDCMSPAGYYSKRLVLIRLGIEGRNEFPDEQGLRRKNTRTEEKRNDDRRNEFPDEQSGEAPVFVSGGKLYKISADSKDKVMSKLGQKVTVTGKIDGDTVTVESVEPSK